MKKQILCAAIFCVLLLAGCGNEKPLDSSVSESVESSVETSTSSAESSSSSTVESSVDMGDGNTDDIAVIVTDNQDILKEGQNSDTTDSPSNSDTSTDVSTSEPTSSSSSSSDTSKPTTSKPTSETSKPTTSSSSSTTSQPTSSSTSGNVPYGGYYDANGVLHCQKANVPKDADGYSVISYTDEYGVGHMTKAEKEAAQKEEQRIDNGGVPNTSGLDLSGWTW